MIVAGRRRARARSRSPWPGPPARRPGTRRAAPGRGRTGWRSPSMRRAASTSPGASEAARPAYRLSVMPTCGVGPAGRASRRTARPWPSSRWCAARTASPASLPAGRVLAGAVAEERRAPRLVERGPVAHPVAERAVHERRVLGEPGGGVPGRPAAGVLQRLRQVPVVERQPRLDAVGQQLVDQPPVEVQPGRVGRAGAVGLHPRPGHREPVRRQAQLGSSARRRRGSGGSGRSATSPVCAADAPARRERERVPDGRRPAVLGRRPLDLVRGGGRAPEEAGREASTPGGWSPGRSAAGLDVGVGLVTT